MPMRAHSVAACRPSEALRPAKPPRSPPHRNYRRFTTNQIKRRPTPPDLFGMAATLPFGADRTNRSGGGGLPSWSNRGKKNPASAGLFSFNSAAGATPAGRVGRERSCEQHRADDDFLEIAHGTFAKVDGTSGIIVLIASRQYPSNTPPVGINA